ncbi:MAG: CPBP family intramembrane metalloprotease [Ruminococcaceae bacterium]|nr:CPBP family intramembrane metalloprotease [Oscillospiraceae bacterium]
MSGTSLYTARTSAVLRVFAAFAAAQAGGLALYWLISGLGEGFRYGLFMNILCSLGVNVVAFTLICGGVHLPERNKRYSRLEPFAIFFAALLIACIAAMLSRALLASEQGGSSASEKDSIDLLLYYGYSIILAPLAEELAFRGAALSKLSRVLGENASALISAALFAAYHMDLSVFAYTFVLGFFLAILAQRSGKLLPCILVHAANNALTHAVGYSAALSKTINIAVPILGIAALSWLILTGRLFGKAEHTDDLT